MQGTYCAETKALLDVVLHYPFLQALKAKNEVIYKYKPDRLETKPAAVRRQQPSQFPLSSDSSARLLIAVQPSGVAL